MSHSRSSDICPLISTVSDRYFHPRERSLLELASSFQCVALSISARGLVVMAYVIQTAKDVRASQDTLLNIFERIEMFFQRLEVYTAVVPTTEMVDMMVQITVEVLSIVGIATKELKQSRTSE